MARESVEATSVREAKLKMLQRHYISFNTFMQDMMTVMGFEATWLQHDIASYLQHGPEYLMIQAQRGEAKSTITACFAVWCLLQDPKHRVLVVSAGGTQANEVATLIQRLIFTVPQLECLRPDPNNGDRTSVEAFDVHYALKGIDKSPSVACIGITGNLPGKRADLLIADDIESPKNSNTAGNRANIHALSLEFSSICTNGRIVYLGTPQSSDSIYNSLPGRGYDIRIWPGRYPTPEQRAHYGQYLAPSIIKRLEANPALAFGGGVLGDMGQPTDPVLLDEEGQQKKWRDKGASSYQLQYMLNTKLMDAMRYPLKLNQLVVLKGNGKTFPLVITRGFSSTSLKPFNSSGFAFELMQPHSTSEEVGVVEGTHMRIDPAGGGQNGDETAYAITSFLNGNVFARAVGGVPGGYSQDSMDNLADLAAKYEVNSISIEKNMGHGAFSVIFLPTLRKKWPSASISDDWVGGQKETRIIGTLEAVINRGSLIICEDVVEQDDLSTEGYEAKLRQSYSLFHQLAKITKVRNALVHDDRADALEGSVRHWLPKLAIDQEARVAAEQAAITAAFMKDPLGRTRYQVPRGTGGPNVFNKYRR